MPTVSVIVPNYNHAPYLKERIESVLTQTYQDFELILLDDCSTDNSAEIINGYAANTHVAHIEVNRRNSGSPFKQWKKGLELARGKYVWIAESDDYAEPEFLEHMVNILNSGCGLAYCRSTTIKGTGPEKHDEFWADGLDNQRWRSNYRNKGTDEINRYLLYRCTIPNASACVFRKDMAKVTRQIAGMRYCGDWLFWIQLLEKCDVGYSAKPENHFRFHTHSTRNKKSEKHEWIKLNEIIYVIQYARKKAGLGLIAPEERLKYDWVFKNFYRKYNPPQGIKHKIIFYSERYYPGLYNKYLAFKQKFIR